MPGTYRKRVAWRLFRALVVGLAPGLVLASMPMSGWSARTPEPEFSVRHPAFVQYFERHGGIAGLGSPISNDFQLLGNRVQIFEQQVLQQRSDGTVLPLDLLDGVLPLDRADGTAFPEPDADLVALVPALETNAYTAKAMAAVGAGMLDQFAPDEWDGSQVNFSATFRGALTCDVPDANGLCDDSTLLARALDLWGLPTSSPTVDPTNPDLISVRFQRRIMQSWRSTGQTTSVPLGSWFKRVLIGTDLPDDVRTEVEGTRFYAEYMPDLPLGVARPIQLPATSLAVAFGGSQVAALAVSPVGPPNTANFAPALPTFEPPTPTSTPEPTAQVPSPTAVTSIAVQLATPSTPQGPDPCAGDEQMMFAPRQPFAGTDVLIDATSARHHDVRSVRLAGPIKAGVVTERNGLNGWVWEWTVTPAVDGWYEFSFYTDGARLCATAGFNALPAFGTTPTATPQPTAQALATATPLATATLTPTVTSTPTATPVLAPVLTSLSPESGSCNQVLVLEGIHFGYPQSAVNGAVIFVGPGGARPGTVLGWGDTQIMVSSPSSAMTAGPYSLIVQVNGVASRPKNYTLAAGCA